MLATGSVCGRAGMICRAYMAEARGSSGGTMPVEDDADGKSIKKNFLNKNLFLLIKVYNFAVVKQK